MIIREPHMSDLEKIRGVFSKAGIVFREHGRKDDDGRKIEGINISFSGLCGPKNLGYSSSWACLSFDRGGKLESVMTSDE